MVTDSLAIALQRLFTNNFHRKSHERVLFITDVVTKDIQSSLSERKIEIIKERSRFVKLLAQRAEDLIGNEKVRIVEYPATLANFKDLPDYIIDAIKETDIFLAITTFSFLYTESFNKIRKLPARGAIMPGFLPAMFENKHPLAVDHLKLKKLGDRIIKKLKTIKKDSVHLIIEDNTNKNNQLELDIFVNNPAPFTNYGLFYEPGSIGILPAGEISLIVKEDSVNGLIEVPKNWCQYCDKNADVLELHFVNGKLVKMNNANTSLQKIMGFISLEDSPGSEELFSSRRVVADFGIGLNPYATNTRSPLEASKILGSIHLGLGENKMFGGTNASDTHIDFIFPGVNLYFENDQIIDSGIIIEEKLIEE